MNPKLLIMAIDAMTPQILYNFLNEFPNMKRYCEKGNCGIHSAYTYGYGSFDNWATVYTGLTPQQHGVIGNKGKRGNEPRIKDVENFNPLWDRFNKHGVTMGMIKGLMTAPPKKIKNYMISGGLNYVDAQSVTSGLVFNQEDRWLKQAIKGELPNWKMPPKISEKGYTWGQINANPKVLYDILPQDYYRDGLESLKLENDFYVKNIVNLYRACPTDIVWYYTAALDIIQHFQWHDKKYRVIKKAYKLLDDMVGQLMESLQPKNLLILSDHGQESFNDIVKDIPIEVQKEALKYPGATWRDDGLIVAPARNGGILTGIHSLQGIYIFYGEDIKKDKMEDVRIVDFYPTLLALFDIEVPPERSGKILDIFKKKHLKPCLPANEKYQIAIFQTIPVPKFNAIVNSTYLRYRDAEIIVFAESKFKSLFLKDPKVKKCYSLRLTKNKEMPTKYIDMVSVIKNGYLNGTKLAIIPYIADSGVVKEIRLELKK